ILRVPTISFLLLVKATVSPALSVAASALSTGNEMGIVHANLRPPTSITSSSRTRLKVALSIGPVRGLRPPSPKRYRLDRSASLMGTFLRDAVLLTNSARSAAGMVRLTGSDKAPCGAIQSAIARLQGQSG